jgi:uncharacterized protein YebE (UPF0316 family)
VVPLPLLIFVAEVCVVTLGTLRIIFVSRGRRLLAPLLGFFEVSIWLFAVGQTMSNLRSPPCYLAFAGGFTLGNLLGLLIERRLALGTVVVRVITNRDGDLLANRLHEAGFGATLLDGLGASGPVKMVFTLVPRRQLALVTALIKEIDPRMFYSVDEIQSASEGIFPRPARPRGLVPWPRLFRSAA